MQINMVDLVVGSAAVWRITHLLHAEDGPWDFFARLRRVAGQSMWGKMLDCFYCLSVWVAIPVTAALGHTWTERSLLLPALSGIAILIERAAASNHADGGVACGIGTGNHSRRNDMSCCGRQRAAAVSERTGVMEPGTPVWFSYAGVQTILVKGPVTGYSYRFGPGTLLRVHGGDAPSMRGIPRADGTLIH